MPEKVIVSGTMDIKTKLKMVRAIIVAYFLGKPEAKKECSSWTLEQIGEAQQFCEECMQLDALLASLSDELKKAGVELKLRKGHKFEI